MHQNSSNPKKKKNAEVTFITYRCNLEAIVDAHQDSIPDRCFVA